MTSKEWQWVKRVNISIKGLLRNKLGFVVNMRSRDAVNIDQGRLLKWLFSGGCTRRWFQPHIQKRDHVMTNILCLQFTSQLCMANFAQGEFVYAMDFASFALISATCLGLYLAWKCKTQQTCKQTVKQLPRPQEIHWSHDHEICHNEITFWYPWMKPTVRAATWRK